MNVDNSNIFNEISKQAKRTVFDTDASLYVYDNRIYYRG